MLILLLPAHAAGLADCPRTFAAGDIVDAAASAEAAFVGVDAAGFASARLTMESRMACSKDILARGDIARVHRVEMLAAFVDVRQAQVPQALAGVFAAEPGHQIPSSLLPEGHPIRGMIPNAMSALHDDPGSELPKPASGWIEVDGAHALRAPAQRSAVLQQIDGQGAVLATHYRWSDETGFAWIVPDAPVETAAVQVGVPMSPTPEARSRWTRRTPLLVLSAASIVASGTLLALAAGEHAEFDASPSLDADATNAERAAYHDELDAVRSKNNGLVYGFYGAAGAGLALGVVTVVTW